MSWDVLFVIILSSIFINNFVLSRFLGLCPFLGVSRRLDSAWGMGLAVIFVMSLASIVTWCISFYLLDPATNIWNYLFQVPLDLTYMRTIAYILVIASLVQFVEMVIQKCVPALYQALGIYLPLITTNCAVLGVCVINNTENYNFIQSLVNGISAGIGFTIALLLMASIREKLDHADIPEPLKGFPIAFIISGLMSIAFLGFSGLLLK
jgi:electron transport complex protein RnfA